MRIIYTLKNVNKRSNKKAERDEKKTNAVDNKIKGPRFSEGTKADLKILYDDANILYKLSNVIVNTIKNLRKGAKTSDADWLFTDKKN